MIHDCTFLCAAKRRLHRLEPLELGAQRSAVPYLTIEAPRLEEVVVKRGGARHGEIRSLTEVLPASLRWWWQWQPEFLSYININKYVPVNEIPYAIYCTIMSFNIYLESR